MATTRTEPMVLVGPRSLEDRICRLVYVRETDEAWAEEWCDRAWVRTQVLARHILKAPATKPSMLRRRGVPAGQGVWDLEPAAA